MSFSDRNYSDPNKPKAATPGPTTDAGKAVSSRNAMKHGCCSTDTLLLSTDNPEDFKALEVTWLKTYNPACEAERHLVQQLAQADWFLQRATRTYAEVEAGLFLSNSNPMEWTEAQERKLGRFLRYKTAHTNNVIKLKKSIEDFRKARAAERADVHKQSLVQERVKALQAKAKAKTGQTWTEHLEGMRQKAIALGFTPPERPLDPTKR